LFNTNNTIIIVGNFNLPLMDWSVSSAVHDSVHSVFLDFCNKFGFSQFVKNPTRGENILDIDYCVKQ